jgi:peptide/nickel transport system permease protein
MKKFFRGLIKRPVALLSFITLIILYMSMFFCEFLSPYTPVEIFKDHSYHPPNIVFYSDTYGVGLQVQKYALINQITWEYAPLMGEYEKVGFFVHGPEYKFWGLFRTTIHLFGVKAPYLDDGRTWKDGGQTYPVFLFGADHLGRDLFTRILYGSRVSLTIGFLGTIISLTLAIILGGLAGYYGGTIDWLVMRFAEFFILIPGLYLILFLRSILSRDLDSGQSFVLITMILAFVAWPGRARVIRGMVHAIKREDFIAAAQLQGIPSLVIIFKQIIPQMASILIIWVTLGIPGFILGETVLSYLGLGIVDPAVSWGVLINKDVTSLGNLRNFPWFLIPGIFLLLTTLAFSFLGDLFRDILDPYFRERN